MAWSAGSSRERILMVADPRAVELEADIPVGDAVALEKGAEVKFFLNASTDESARSRAHSSGLPRVSHG